MQTAYMMAATEIVKWIVNGGNKKLENNLVTFNSITFELQNHILVKRFQCSDCGKHKHFLNDQPKPVVLRSLKKTFTIDGGHRTSSLRRNL